jgi:hypothetical protein
MPWPILRYIIRICLKQLRETIKASVEIFNENFRNTQQECFSFKFVATEINQICGIYFCLVSGSPHINHKPVI